MPLASTRTRLPLSLDRAGVGVHEREAEGERCERNIGAANVEQPGYASRIADHGCILTRLAKQRGDLCSFVLCWTPGIFHWMWDGLF